MTDRRPLLRAIFDAAVAAAHPDVVLAAHLRPVPKGKVICLAAGKGAAAMAAAAERHYLDALELDPARLSGLATPRHGHGVPTRRIKVIEAGHPVPDEAGLRGAEESLRLAESAHADDLLLVLLSGGGSANWIAPVEGVSFAQKQQLTRALLRSGAPIGEVNTVRKHLSRIKGGRLARAGQHAADIVTLAISDEPRDVAADHARLALDARARGKRVAILSGGELTVTVRGNGRGGPNQEYALALADLLKDTTGIAAIAGDTDGADGGAGSACDAAGAIIDQGTFAKMASLNLDPRAYLDNNDATTFFE